MQLYINLNIFSYMRLHYAMQCMFFNFNGLISCLVLYYTLLDIIVNIFQETW